MSNQLNQEIFQRRIRERHFWFRLGVYCLAIGVIVFVVSMISAFFDLLPFLFLKKLLNFGLYGIFLGIIFGLFFSRIGWSKSLWLDLLLNRLSLLLIVIGITLEMNIFQEIFYFQDIPYGYGVTILGIILGLLGMRFQSSTNEPIDKSK